MNIPNSINSKSLNLDSNPADESSNYYLKDSKIGNEINRNYQKQKIKFAHENAIKFNLIFTFTVYGLISASDVYGSVLKSGESYLNCTIEDLQKEEKPKVGRIEVNSIQNKPRGITSGQLKIPVVFDKWGASILAAGIETTVEKIASFKGIFITDTIEDCRENVKSKVLKNSKIIYNCKFETKHEANIPDLTSALKKSLEVTECIEREDEIVEGTDFEDSKNVFLVEGRADVLKLSSFGLNNVISTNGTKVPQSLKPRLAGKVITLISDQDRGGEFIREKLKTMIPEFYIVDLPALETVEKINRSLLFKYLKAKYLFRKENNEIKK